MAYQRLNFCILKESDRKYNVVAKCDTINSSALRCTYLAVIIHVHVDTGMSI